jgi:hypothetical protein
MIQTEETWLPIFMVWARTRRTTFDSSRVVLETNRKTPAVNTPFRDLFERFAAVAKVVPALLLF